MSARGVDEVFADLHQVGGYIANRERLLESDEPLPGEPPLDRESREAILRFVRQRKSERQLMTIRKYYAWLPQLAARLGGELFLRPTRETPRRFDEVYPLSTSRSGRKKGTYSQHSREGCWRVGTAFWVARLEEVDGDLPNWMRKKFPKRDYHRLDPTKILSREEVSSIADHTYNTRDRALIWTMWALARRPSEVISLRVGDIERMERYCRVYVGGKKGSPDAGLPVYENAYVALVKWLADHPERKNPEAPLWVDSLRPGGHGGPLGYHAVVKLVAKAARLAGVTKPSFLYAFRHAGGMEKARNPDLSESVFERAMGWRPGSAAKRAYVNLSGKDVENAENASRGIIPSARSRGPAPQPQDCPACRLPNQPGAKYCSTCGLPLSIAAVGEIEEMRTLFTRLTKVLKEPRVGRAVERALARTR